jgi:hypothetical protein
MVVQEEIDEQGLNGGRIEADLVIARRFGSTQFQPVQRRLAGERRTNVFVIYIAGLE